MDFIRTYENVLSTDLIRRLILWADEGNTEIVLEQGKHQFGHQGKGIHGRHDEQKFLKYSNFELYKDVHDEMMPFWQEYSDEFESVKGIMSNEAKLQKTPIKGGYSVWHAEQGDRDAATRALVWMVYLNTVEDGGETEFLHQKIKIKPTRGTLVLWPASYTHVHRGNPPYSEEKYIVTGWGHFPLYTKEDLQK